MPDKKLITIFVCGDQHSENVQTINDIALHVPLKFENFTAPGVHSNLTDIPPFK